MTKIKTWLPALCVAAFASIMALWVSCGCSTVAPGSDPLVVRTEQAETVATNTFDLFLEMDDLAAKNAATSNLWVPAHSFAQYLRQPVTNGTVVLPFGLSAVLSLDKIKMSYESGAASSNSLIAALAVLQSTISQAANYSSLINTNKL